MNKETFYSYLGRFLAFPMVADTIIKLAKRRVYNHIHNGAYMERYWLLREGSWLSRTLGIAIRLHVINDSDGDRAMHTHPFKFKAARYFRTCYHSVRLWCPQRRLVL